jgi:hypothetical protein
VAIFISKISFSFQRVAGLSCGCLVRAIDPAPSKKSESFPAGISGGDPINLQGLAGEDGYETAAVRVLRHGGTNARGGWRTMAAEYADA